MISYLCVIVNCIVNLSDDIVPIFFSLNNTESSCVILVILHALYFRVRVHAKAIYCSRLLTVPSFFLLGIVAEIQNSRTEAKT